MRYVSKFLLGIYLFFLLWLILFKLSFNLPQFLTYSYSNVNLVPFSTFSFENTTVLRETTYNLIVFFPFGVLLNVNFKRLSFLKIRDYFPCKLLGRIDSIPIRYWRSGHH